MIQINCATRHANVRLLDLADTGRRRPSSASRILFWLAQVRHPFYCRDLPQELSGRARAGHGENNQAHARDAQRSVD